MYAPGLPPTAPRRVPSRSWIVSMRVLFTVLAVFSCGLLLWAPLLRLAIVRRRTLDWWVAGAGFVLVCVLLPVIGRDGNDTDAHGVDYVLIPVLLLAMVAAPVHFLVADIRHYAQLTGQNVMGGPVPPMGGYPYVPTVPMQTPMQPPGQPLPPQPYAQQQYQQPQPTPQPHSTPHSQPVPSAHQPQPPTRQPSSGPHPQRIDQVRAELDELSDYLRKEEGR
ncbi:hypothetical protein [Streptomyces sp. NBC_01013]|uniref:hypothetical protein n=1 Tax=Streptomyces sp. NBC_01013 TaxID=2903718 RepID=UPI0038664216|nr:hypothetical protein OG538_22155 [Streptomyces sp. NBC_01013]